MIKKKIKKLKVWWVNHLPFITTKRRQDDFVIDCLTIMERMDKKSTWAAIHPVIFSLRELRRNTWDVERVDNAIKWLEDNFKVENR